MNETILTWVIFILAFGGMVLIHEFGHFIAARLCKIEVEEFGIGLPTPGALTLFTWQGTRFTLNWLPLGGFVRPKGENDPNVPGGLAAASPWKRLFVLSAGPFMNLLTAVLIYSLIFNRVGVPDATRVSVSSVSEDGPAAQAGFQAGDIFVSGNGQPIGSFDELREIVDAHENEPVIFVVDRKGEQIELTATPRLTRLADGTERIMIGIGLGSPFKTPESPLETLRLGAQYTYYNVEALLSLPAQMLRGSLNSEESRLVGLKGIFDVLQQTVSRDVEASTTAPTSSDPVDQPILTLELIARLSISLGLFNLFPFPALDGGRIIFVLPELIFRRRVSPQLENMVHAAGMLVLLILMVYINVMDFIDPVSMPIP